jgi:hypothetical protein
MYSLDKCIYLASLSFYTSCSMADVHRSLFCGHGMDGKQAGPSDACSEVASDLREMALTLAGT